MADTIHVEGLKELDRAFGKLSKDLRKELRDELRAAGRIVSAEAKTIAAQKGLVRSGKLVRAIRPTVKGGSLFVRDGARGSDGFPYPKRYEFEGGRRQPSDAASYRGTGSRAFMRPALERTSGQVVERIDEMLGRLAGENGFN